jgi:hypothetical protein
LKREKHTYFKTTSVDFTDALDQDKQKIAILFHVEEVLTNVVQILWDDLVHSQAQHGHCQRACYRLLTHFPEKLRQLRSGKKDVLIPCDTTLKYS